jgi:CheY-like chemotaxis protein
MESLQSMGLFVYIDDDADDHKLMRIALEHLEIRNEVKYFFGAEEALAFLKSTREQIFLILCDVNMPKINGLEFKRIIELTPELKLKSIPFVFLSTSAGELEVKEAYSLGIQGYFQKGMDINVTIEYLRKITSFWASCVHPQKFIKI